MARSAPRLTKTVSEANLSRLDKARLARLLLVAAAGDAGFKRRLRLELAAELGAADLAAELDRRLDTLAASRSRVSWRKRPDLLREMAGLKELIVDRLAGMDPELGLSRLIAWFDLADPLGARVKDTKGELAALFDEAAGDLAVVAERVGAEIAAPLLVEAIDTRAVVWAPILARAAPGMSVAMARAVLGRMGPPSATASTRRRLAARRLADRAGDVEAWVASLSAEDRRSPRLGAEAALRLAGAGRAGEAREALEACRPQASGVRWGRPNKAPPAPDEAWRSAEIAVLDAEGQGEAASAARWEQFERTLSVETLRAILAPLADFEDVVAADRAVDYARGYFDLMAALEFLMSWGALREAAGAISARSTEIVGAHSDLALWASRLAARHPAAAAALLQARARTLPQRGPGHDAESEAILAEAESLMKRAIDTTR